MSLAENVTCREQADQLYHLLEWANSSEGHAGATYAKIRQALNALVRTETRYDISDCDILLGEETWLEGVLEEAQERLDDYLRPMVNQYLETALWSSTGDDMESLDNDFNIDDIDEESRKQAVFECREFYLDNQDDIRAAVETNLEISNIGHDFWLTRNRHGAGFWDGDYRRDIGKRLTDAAHVWGSVDIIVLDDNTLSFS